MSPAYMLMYGVLTGAFHGGHDSLPVLRFWAFSAIIGTLGICYVEGGAFGYSRHPRPNEHYRPIT